MNCKINDVLYQVCHDGYGSFVVPVRVVEVEDIYDDVNQSIWHYTYEDGSERVLQGGKELTVDALVGKQKVNQYVWIDEPVGHSVSIDSFDDVYLTLNEALLNAHPSRKKHLRRRLKRYRNHFQSFISKTWIDVVGRLPKFEKLPNKKVYVRR